MAHRCIFSLCNFYKLWQWLKSTAPVPTLLQLVTCCTSVIYSLIHQFSPPCFFTSSCERQNSQYMKETIKGPIKRWHHHDDICVIQVMRSDHTGLCLHAVVITCACFIMRIAIYSALKAVISSCMSLVPVIMTSFVLKIFWHLFPLKLQLNSVIWDDDTN